ncbi:MAG TPA: hypothetical protein VEX13_01490, partial [Chloroflexia bacterium]|nr:hypothetical protein [Chloroflexia bacterium]
METGLPPKIRRVDYRDIPAVEPPKAVDPIRIVAGIGAILFPVLNVLALPFLFISMLRPSESNPVAGVIFMI